MAKTAPAASQVQPEPEAAPVAKPPPTKLSLWGRRDFETLSPAELDQLRDMIAFIAMEGEAGRATLRKVLDNNWREFMVWCRIALGLKGNDTSRDLVIRRTIDRTIQDVIRDVLDIAKD